MNETKNNIILFNSEIKYNLDVYIDNKKINMIFNGKNWIIDYNFEYEGVYTFTIRFYDDIIDCQYLFEGSINLISIDLSDFNTLNIINMSHMFACCSKLKEIKGLNNFITDNVTDMSGMFWQCKELNYLNLSNFNTSNVTNMKGIFSLCNNLKEIEGINNFITNKLKDVSLMFANCNKLEYLDLSNCDASNVINMVGMFASCYKLEIINGINKFNTSKV